MKKNYYSNYLHTLINNINKFDFQKSSIVEKKIQSLKKHNKIIFFGNGGSASICNHFAIDFSKNLKIKTLTFNDSTITCLANDYGYENWIQKAIDLHANKGDIIIFISSSGNSLNHLKGAKFCRKKKLYSISYTGFYKNKLSKITNTSFLVNSKNYNIIENCHSVWLLMILDKLFKAKF